MIGKCFPVPDNDLRKWTPLEEARLSASLQAPVILFFFFLCHYFYFSCVCCRDLGELGHYLLSKGQGDPHWEAVLAKTLHYRRQILHCPDSYVSPASLGDFEILLDSCSSAGGFSLPWSNLGLVCSFAICPYLCYFANLFPVAGQLLALFTVFQNKGFLGFLNYILKYICGPFYRNLRRKGVVQHACSNHHLRTEVSTSFSKTITNTIYSPVYGMRVKSPWNYSAL